jgi:hypothetical protein
MSGHHHDDRDGEGVYVIFLRLSSRCLTLIYTRRVPSKVPLVLFLPLATAPRVVNRSCLLFKAELRNTFSSDASFLSGTGLFILWYSNGPEW